MPMRSQRYSLNTPTLAIHQDGQNSPITIPNGAVVKVIAGRLDGNRLVDITWDSKTALMFTTDIRERCEKVKDA